MSAQTYRIGAFPFILHHVPCGSIICIRFYGYNLSRNVQHPVISVDDAKVCVLFERNKFFKFFCMLARVFFAQSILSGILPQGFVDVFSLCLAASFRGAACCLS